MGNKDLFQRVKELNLPIGKYVLFGSTPMGIRGLKDCNDVDLLVTEDIWESYKGKDGWKQKMLDDGRPVLINDKLSLDLGTTWGPGVWDPKKIMREAEIIDGLPFASLEDVLKWKKIIGRKKDLKDIEIIEDFLYEK